MTPEQTKVYYQSVVIDHAVKSLVHLLAEASPEAISAAGQSIDDHSRNLHPEGRYRFELAMGLMRRSLEGAVALRAQHWGQQAPQVPQQQSPPATIVVQSPPPQVTPENVNGHTPQVLGLFIRLVRLPGTWYPVR